MSGVSLQAIEFTGAVASDPTLRGRRFTVFRDNCLRVVEYPLAVEERLEIFVDGCLRGATMRSPGDDVHLAAGFCFTEGIIGGWEEIDSVKEFRSAGGVSQILIELRAKSRGRKRAAAVPRSAVFTPCGIETLFASRQAVEDGQRLFSRTGSTHACAIFDKAGKMLSLAEDVGRHNALDRAVGVLLRKRKQKEGYLLSISSRLSAEIVRKASRLGIEILAGMSAATESGVQTALDSNLTLIGFLRESSLTIYTHPHRVTVS